MNLLVAALALAAGAAIVAGCSESADSAAFGEPTPTQGADNGPVGKPTIPTSDAGTQKAPAFRGNPLCRVTNDSCMPDDDGFRRTLGTDECAIAPPDAGDAAPAATDGSRACRIDKSSTGVVEPKCFAETAIQGDDGASCVNGEDCAPGFDCVAGDKGTKACRHYCCSGTCKGHTSQNGGATFCDVRSLVGVNLKAPVCMPLKRCSLLGMGECTSYESCAVVTEAGDTGCVTVGDQQVGDSCDEDHCAATLTCLGQPGSRKCYKLCKVSSDECAAPQVCKTSTLFKDPEFGICQKP